MVRARQHHQKLPAAFDRARLEAHGAIAGWMYGKGEVPPNLTANLRDAYDRAFAVAFDRGYEACLRENRDRLRAGRQISGM